MPSRAHGRFYLENRITKPNDKTGSMVFQNVWSELRMFQSQVPTYHVTWELTVVSTSWGFMAGILRS